MNLESTYYTISSNVTLELTFNSSITYEDPFNSIEVDLLLENPDGKSLRVPMFWAGGDTWKARYASPLIGTHTFQTECSDASNKGLHGITGDIAVTAYEGDNELYRCGGLQLSSDRHTFEHDDGSPFFWMGDTWWMAFCKRLHWPEEFKELTADRKEKGFNVVQIVAGLYPDMEAFSPLGANESGFPWQPDYSRINPSYFDQVDKRFLHLVDEGMIPCVVGAWGYHIKWMPAEQLKKHWRYLIARYGAFPVVWCVAGEANLPWYGEWKGDAPHEDTEQAARWVPFVKYVKETDPFDRLVSIHPTALGKLSARGIVGYENANLIDFDMLQTGHSQYDSLMETVDVIRGSRQNESSAMPVINSEVVYEGLLGWNPAYIQRAFFWSCVLNGAAGHTYGANGIWQVNREGEPYGLSPNNTNWGTTPWNEAMHLPGGTQVAWGARFIKNFPWNQFEFPEDWASKLDSEDEIINKSKNIDFKPFAAGIVDQIRLIYLPTRMSISVDQLPAHSYWTAKWVNPSNGIDLKINTFQVSAEGSWEAPPMPKDFCDALLILSKA